MALGCVLSGSAYCFVVTTCLAVRFEEMERRGLRGAALTGSVSALIAALLDSFERRFLDGFRGRKHPETRLCLAQLRKVSNYAPLFLGTDGCRSGRTGSPGKRVYSKRVPRVRIPPHPPFFGQAVRAPRHARRRLKQWVHGEGVWKSLWGFEEVLPGGLWALTLRSLHGLNSPFTVSGTADAC